MPGSSPSASSGGALARGRPAGGAPVRLLAGPMHAQRQIRVSGLICGKSGGEESADGADFRRFEDFLETSADIGDICG